MDKEKNTVLIIGAGPSGLAAAYELIQLNANLKPVIVEKLPCAGGLARTIYDGKSGIDIGGHRLFTKDKYIENIWKKFLIVQNTPSVDDFLAHRTLTYPKEGADPNFVDDVLLIRKRFSAILKNNKLYSYPIRFSFNTFKNLGLINSIIALASYFKSLICKKDNNNIKNFLINRFGYFLYSMFFDKHSKKVWGLDPSLIINHWPKRRVQRMLFRMPSMWEDEYFYPKYGCSQLWNKMAQYILQNGGEIYFNSEFLNFNLVQDKIVSASVNINNVIKEIQAKYFISTIPIANLIKSFDAPYDIKQYALNLPYRDYILVSLFTSKFNLENNTKFPTVSNKSPCSWIYLQNDDTKASRLQIMNNWSPYMVEDFKDNFIISLEYFCSQNDNLWNMSDYELSKLAISEIEKYNLFSRYDINKSIVIREPKAYPIYSGSYQYIDKIKKYLGQYDNLFLSGRNGLHQYINMDYAMVCGINIARDIVKKV